MNEQGKLNWMDGEEVACIHDVGMYSPVYLLSFWIFLICFILEIR